MKSFVLDFSFLVVGSFSCFDIWFTLKVNISNLSNLIFSNTFISDILLWCKFKSFNSLKYTFANILISDIWLLFKYNISNLSNLTFSNTFISDISFQSKRNFFNSLKFTFSNILIFEI